MREFELKSYPELATFLRNETAATLAVPIDNNGTIHAASLLYWNSEEPLSFYFVTNRDSEKTALLKSQKEIPGACVVGTSRGTAFTLQMRGALGEANPAPAIVDAYYKKRGDKFDDLADEKNMMLVFHPSWARFTDYGKGYERFVLAV